MSNRTNGAVVRQLEEAFAKYVGAQYAIACCNGTATLHTALVALGVQPGDRVAVPPLTMASTTLAVLHAGGVPVYEDVDPRWWGMISSHGGIRIPVSLYGLWSGFDGSRVIDDAAQTLNPHRGAAFTSYSFQASKLMSAGEGGMLCTNDAELARRARWFSNLGYPESKTVSNLKHPTAIRHIDTAEYEARSAGIGMIYPINSRMADCQAALLLPQLARADEILAARRYAADCYRQAISGCDWITPQHVPDGWPMSWWTFAIALRTKELWDPFVAALEAAGSERPYAAWRITYHEPAFEHLMPDGLWRCDTCGVVRESNKLPGSLRCTHWGGTCPGIAYPSGGCPVAEDLQPRLVQLQTNYTKAEAEQAAERLHRVCRRAPSPVAV